MTTIKDFPLRERKKAQTKLAIIDALLIKLKNNNFEEITIDELCDDIEISRGTFFNYFPRKVDMILYNALLWNLEAMWHTTKTHGTSPGLNALKNVFAWFAGIIEQHPRFFLEIIALISREPQEFIKFNLPESKKVSKAERILRFPELKGVESITEGNSSQLFRINLEAAITNDELPDNADIEAGILSLGIILYGIPLMLMNTNPGNLAEAFSYQLDLLWKGLKTTVH